jgi:hypothetical protein
VLSFGDGSSCAGTDEEADGEEGAFELHDFGDKVLEMIVLVVV